MSPLEEKYNIAIVYEDNHLIIINKKPSQIAQEDKTGDVPLTTILKAYLKEKYNKPGNVYLGLVHRLDRPTSGLLVFAKTDKAGKRLSELFKNRELSKKYWAVVQKAPPQSEALLQNYLKKNEQKNKSFVVNEKTTGAKKAELKYKYLLSSDRYHLLEIELLSGRHHQIRCQLAHIGCIVKGDVKYGFDRANDDLSIHLHSYSIDFIHPVKKEPMHFLAKPPEDPIWNYFWKSINGNL